MRVYVVVSGELDKRTAHIADIVIDARKWVVDLLVKNRNCAEGVEVIVERKDRVSTETYDESAFDRRAQEMHRRNTMGDDKCDE